MRLLHRSGLALVAIISLAAVVLTLAVLQYRWTGQVSQAAEERMQEALNTSTRQFRQDFSRELNRLGGGFELDPAALPSQSENNVLSHYGDWYSRALYRNLLAGVYLWRIDGNAPRLLSLDRKSFQFVEVAWPARLEALRKYLEEQSWTLSGISEREAYRYPWILHAVSAALVHPLFYVSPGEGAPAQEAQHLGFLVLELSRQCLQTEYLPTLTRRYFGSGDQSAFLVAVRAVGDVRAVLYQSDPSLPLSDTHVDAAVNVLDPANDQWGEHAGAALAPANEINQWQLAVQHRAGSLAAAVAALRRRNLAVSFSLLSLLAGSMALIIVLSRRAQRLANLQMEFVAGVSHELRTPLAVICSAADNLADGVVGSPEQAREYGGLVRSEGRRLTRLVEQILVFAAGQANRAGYDLQPVQMEAAIERALAGAAPMLTEAGFEVEKSIAPGLPPVIADTDALNQCLENLIGNAIKYGRPGRWLSVQASSSTEASRTEVQVSVEDRGAGIPSADLPHIFEPFYRTKAAREGQIRGVGLGLHLVKRMMQGMGGRVSVWSKTGRGSKFTLHLPVLPLDES